MIFYDRGLYVMCAISGQQNGLFMQTFLCDKRKKK